MTTALDATSRLSLTLSDEGHDDEAEPPGSGTPERYPEPVRRDVSEMPAQGRSSSMECSTTHLENGVVVIGLDGRLNMASAATLRQTVTTLVQQGSSRFAVDLSRISFMDSSGLGALISGLKTARQAGGDLRITAPTEQVQLVLQLTNMERVLTAYDSVESAFGSA